MTLYDNQEKVVIKAYQGEGDYPEDNKFIGEFTIDGLSKAPSGNVVLIHFKLDLNGMLHVTATEKSTGHSKSVVMDTRAQDGKEEITSTHKNIQALLESSVEVDTIEESETDGALQQKDEIPSGELLIRAKELRKRAEAILETGISEDDAKEISETLHKTAVAIKEKQWTVVQDNNDSLSDVLFYLEE